MWKTVAGELSTSQILFGDSRLVDEWWMWFVIVATGGVAGLVVGCGLEWSTGDWDLGGWLATGDWRSGEFGRWVWTVEWSIRDWDLGGWLVAGGVVGLVVGCGLWNGVSEIGIWEGG